jgi:ABC-type Zn uptake system ZnuABC Zn-binding protein ZnuA
MVDTGFELLTSVDDLTEVDLLPGEKINVVTTTNILADVLANIGGDRVDLRVLIPAGADPHAYQPTPQDLTLIANADVVFINGLGLETFLEDVLNNAGDNTVVVSLSEGVQARAADAHHDDQHDDHDEDFADVDAHVWLDPKNVNVWVDNAERALSALDPANAGEYSSSTDEYRDLLDDLHTWIIDRISQIPQPARLLVTDHMAMGYFADRYGFEIVGAIIPAHSTVADVSARELAILQQAIEASGATAVFVAVGSNPIVSEQLAIDLDLLVVQLYIGALSAPSGPAATYLDLMHYNVDKIVNALQN